MKGGDELGVDVIVGGGHGGGYEALIALYTLGCRAGA